MKTNPQVHLHELKTGEFETILPGDEEKVLDLLEWTTTRVVVIHHTMFEFVRGLIFASYELLKRNFDLLVWDQNGNIVGAY